MPSQTPCAFFARGNCRFGINCRNSHDQGGHGNYQATNQYHYSPSSYYRNKGSSSFQAVDPKLQAAITESSQNLDKQKEFIAQSLINDLIEWENTNLWPLSCFGPIADKRCIPFFEDLSKEEVRYQTFLNGGNPPDEIALKLAQAKKLRLQIIQNPNVARNVIDQILDSSMQQKPSLSHTQAPPVTNFSGQQQQSNQSMTSPSISPSIFGGRSGASSPNQVFGASQSQTNVYGATTFSPMSPRNPGSFSFSPEQIQQFNTGFSGGIKPQDIFSTPTPKTAQNFSFSPQNIQQQKIQPVGAQAFSFTLNQQQQPQVLPNQTSQFTFPNSNNVAFANQQNFVQQQQIQTQSPTGGFFQSSFGRPVQQYQPAQETQTRVTYSELSDLTPDEIKEYHAEGFSNIDSIPLKPPTREMCLRN